MGQGGSVSHLGAETDLPGRKVEKSLAEEDGKTKQILEIEQLFYVHLEVESSA